MTALPNSVLVSVALIMSYLIWYSLSQLENPVIWSNLGDFAIIISGGWLIAIVASLLYALPENFRLRKFIPVIGDMYIPLLLVLLFCLAESALFSWSLKLFAAHVKGSPPSFWAWFAHGFTPIISISLLGGGMGLVMLFFNSIAFLVGSALLGLVYGFLATQDGGLNRPDLAVLLSCVLKVGIVVSAPAMGMIGGHQMRIT